MFAISCATGVRVKEESAVTHWRTSNAILQHLLIIAPVCIDGWGAVIPSILPTSKKLNRDVLDSSGTDGLLTCMLVGTVLESFWAESQIQWRMYSSNHWCWICQSTHHCCNSSQGVCGQELLSPCNFSPSVFLTRACSMSSLEASEDHWNGTAEEACKSWSTRSLLSMLWGSW